MSKTIRNIAVASISWATTLGTALAADSADLVVKGVIKPSACTTSLSSGGVLNFGTITVDRLSSIAPTRFPAQEFVLTINCAAATRVGLTVVDGRANTKNASAAAVLGEAYAFGVGTVNGKNVGAYDMKRDGRLAAVADGYDARLIFSQDGGKTWRTYITEDWSMPNVRIQSWAVMGSQTPGAFKRVMQPFRVHLVIGKADELPAITDEVPIDGQMTFQIKYL